MGMHTKPVLSKGLSATLSKASNAIDLSSVDVTNAYRLTHELNKAAVRNLAADVERIVAATSDLIDEGNLDQFDAICTTRNLVGTNAFHGLLGALNDAASRKATASVASIAALIRKLAQKYREAGKLHALFAGLEVSCTAFFLDWQGTNGFYWLVSALNNAVIQKDPKSIAAIAGLLNDVIDQCDTSLLLQGFSQEFQTGDWRGVNGFYRLMTAVYNSKADIVIDLVTKLVAKCDTPELRAKLREGFAQKRAEGNWQGYSGSAWLEKAFQNAKNDHGRAEKLAQIRNTLTGRPAPVAASVVVPQALFGGVQHEEGLEALQQPLLSERTPLLVV